MARSLAILFFWGSLALAEPAVPPTDSAPKLAQKPKLAMLSWAPLDFLKKGYRSAPWVYDPFYPTAREFRLEGIISSEQAFINGRWIRQGEVVDGYEVKSITAAGVMLKRHAEILILKIGETTK